MPVIPAAFSYQRPATVDEALRAIAADPDAQVLAGGHSLLPLLKLRLARTDALIDIGRLPELKGLRYAADGSASVGALTTYAELIEATKLDFVREGLLQAADVQVRNRATVGGAVAHADPASDLPAMLIALDASIVLRSAVENASWRRPTSSRARSRPPSGRTSWSSRSGAPPCRKVPAARTRSWLSPRRATPWSASRHRRPGRRAHRARPGRPDGRLRGRLPGDRSRGGLSGGRTARPRRSPGRPPSDRQPTVNSDIHADREYRTAMAEVYTRRAIEAALARAT